MTINSQENKTNHRTLWEEAIQLGIVNSPYPGTLFARIIQRDRLIKQIEKFRNGTEEERREVQEFLASLIAMHHTKYPQYTVS